jgi:multidrug efflux pump subunit AcrA (membrane-fusion protein)
VLHRNFATTLLALILLSFTLGGCGEQAGDMQAAAPAVTVIKIEPGDTPVAIEFVGKTASSRRVEIRSRVEGFLDKRVYVEGSMVEAGDVLFEMDKKPFEAQLQAAKAELAQHQARKETALINLNRIRPLAKKMMQTVIIVSPPRRWNSPWPGWSRQNWILVTAPSRRRLPGCRVLPSCGKVPTSGWVTAC